MEGEVATSDEILLIMESRADLFDEIEKTVRKIHTYETFVLTAVKIEKTSRAAAEWLGGELKKQHNNAAKS